MNIIKKLAGYFAETDNLPKVYALAVCLAALIGLCMIPVITYDADQLYPKSVDIKSPLSPYDRGGVPFEEPAEIIAQYPENAPALGWVTAYLTPASQWMADNTLYLGTTIAAHPGGILDEILYYTRGFDTIVEASILLCAFAIASFLYRRLRT